MALCYGASLWGGYVADKGLGVKNTIIGGGLLSAAGVGCILSASPDLVYFGLALTSLGSGFVRPNILVSAGIIFENGQNLQKDKAYQLLYIAMNIGGLLASVGCGLVGKIWGWSYAMALITIFFLGGTCFVYKTMHLPPEPRKQPTLSRGSLIGGNFLVIGGLYLLFRYQESFHSLIGIIILASIVCLGRIFYLCDHIERKNVLSLTGYVLVFAIFCTLHEQAGTSLMLFYEKVVNRDVMGFIIPSSALLSLDPLFVLLCGPFLIYLSSRYLEKTKPIEGFVKTGAGFLCVAIAFGALSASTCYSSVSLLWIVGAFFIHTLGELWIAPVSFAKISHHAPPRFRSILMSFSSMAIAYGHYFAGLVASLSLSNNPSLSGDHPLQTYRHFFFKLAITAMCAGLSLLLYQAIKKNIVASKGKSPPGQASLES